MLMLTMREPGVQLGRRVVGLSPHLRRFGPGQFFVSSLSVISGIGIDRLLLPAKVLLNRATLRDCFRPEKTSRWKSD